MDGTKLRREIQLAWHRASLNGLDPGTPLVEEPICDVDPGSRLMVAAGPVLDDFARQMAGMPYCLMLADRHARIIDRRCGQPGMNALLDRVLCVPGHTYREETTGTNALATAFELRTAFAVSGEEHFLESMRDFSCYAQPILHPLTRRLEGLLDISAYASHATPLFRPYLSWAVRAIEQRLELGSGLTQRQMLAAFQERSRRSRNPVLVFGEDLTLANAAASDRFDGADQLVLREAALESAGGRPLLEIRPGLQVQLRCDWVEGTSAVLVEVLAPGRQTDTARGRVEDRFAEWRRLDTRVLVHGEPGSGRSRATRRLAGERGVDLLDAIEVAGNSLAVLSRASRALVVVEHIHILPPAAAVRLAAALDASARWYALTCTVPAELEGEQRTLAGRCAARHELSPLRARRSELPRIAQEMLAEIRPGSGLRLTAGALRVLLDWDWPGNLRELRTVLEAAAARRSAGDVLDTDIALAARPRSARGARTPLEQAERDTIRAALDRARGNKSIAASELGIGRTTLYRKLRELGIEA
jgi:transcriptional regulator of acetoin/glycerol metabolism